MQMGIGALVLNRIAFVLIPAIFYYVVVKLMLKLTFPRFFQFSWTRGAVAFLTVWVAAGILEFLVFAWTYGARSTFWYGSLVMSIGLIPLFASSQSSARVSKATGA